MMFDFAQLFSTDYLFSSNPGGDFLLGYGLLIFFVLTLFARSIAVAIGPKENKYYKKSLRKKFGKFIALGIIGLILVASRFSAVPYFSMRVLVYAVFLLTVFFAVRTFLRIRAEYAKRMDAVEREKGKRA